MIRYADMVRQLCRNPSDLRMDLQKSLAVHAPHPDLVVQTMPDMTCWALIFPPLLLITGVSNELLSHANSQCCAAPPMALQLLQFSQVLSLQ